MAVGVLACWRIGLLVNWQCGIGGSGEIRHSNLLVEPTLEPDPATHPSKEIVRVRRQAFPHANVQKEVIVDVVIKPNVEHDSREIIFQFV
jgi:hypothetical protein